MLSNVQNGSALAARPASVVNRLTPAFDRLFEDFFAPIDTPAWSSLPLSMWEDDNQVYLEVDAPGMTENDIEVSVHNDEMIIQGERKCERKHGGYDTRTYGRFEQRIGLPSAIDADKVEARLANGVLSVTLPKSEKAKPRRIPLKSETSEKTVTAE